MSLSTNTNSNIETGSNREEQSTLHDFGVEFSRIPQWLDYSKYRFDEMEIFVKGEILENEIFERPNYDVLEFVIAEKEDLGSGSLRDTPKSRQEIESFLKERGDLKAFNQVAKALENPEESLIWEDFDERGIPLKSDFYFQDSVFRIDKQQVIDSDQTVYPVSDYLARKIRPYSGVQVGLSSARRNIAKGDKEALITLVDALKDSGATTYLTGSVLHTSDYNDIDIAVDALARPAQTPLNRTQGGVYPQGESEYEGLPSRMRYRRSKLEHFLEQFDGLEVVSKNLREDNLGENTSHGYNVVGDLYTVEIDGTIIDIGYDEEPFTDYQSRNPLETDSETEFATI